MVFAICPHDFHVECSVALFSCFCRLRVNRNEGTAIALRFEFHMPLGDGENCVVNAEADVAARAAVADVLRLDVDRCRGDKRRLNSA